ncbi:MAG TPA: GIDE domain-containing protein [Gammaproteobacteria bacterium]|nr:GIDE domain-containing protein [Gammaproteobacteria bacterium]
MDLDTVLTLIFVCLPIFFALICFYYAIYFIKAARNIEDSPTSKIRSAAQGYVELKGTPQPLSSHSTIGKLTQKPCAWYRYKVEIFQTVRTSTQTNAGWRLLDQGISHDSFLLDDGTGECVIQPPGAEIMPTQGISWRGHTRIPSPPSTSFLRWLFWDSWGSYRYTEYRLEFDAPIYASGMFFTLSSTDPRIQDALSLKSYLAKNNLSTCNLLSKEGLVRNQNYIISAIPESRVIRQFKIKAFIFFIVFVFFSVLSLNSSYPLIKKSFQDWKKYKLPT